MMTKLTDEEIKRLQEIKTKAINENKVVKK